MYINISEKKKVYYVANRSNTKIVELLRKFKKFCDVDFIAIEEKNAAGQIEHIDQPKTYPAVLIWTTGYNHHHSFCFDYKGDEKVIKRNIDAHPDWLPFVIDPSYKRGKVEVNYSNHLARSEEFHNYTAQFALPSVSEISAGIEFYFYLDDALSAKRISKKEKEELSRAFDSRKVKLEDNYEKNYKLHISVDLDSVSSFFSANEIWVVGIAFEPTAIAKSVRLAKDTGNLVRFDIGGCYDPLPDFEFNPSINLQNPSFGVPMKLTIPAILALFNGGKFSDYYILPKSYVDRKVPKNVVDNICSYAFLCYKKILEAVLFD